MAQSQWKFDRHIPVAFIMTVLLQTGGAFWWASKMDAAVLRNSDDIASIREQTEHNRALFERVVRLEVVQENSIKMLYRIDAKLTHRQEASQ